jgi:hypothetical protein
MKEKYVDGEITYFQWDKALREWTATFTERELRDFVKRIRKRAEQRRRLRYG